MKRIGLLFICVCMVLSVLVSCKANEENKRKEQVPDEQVKYDIVSTVEDIERIEDSIVEWSITHQPDKNTHTDSLKIYVKDKNNIIYENISYRYTYDSQTDLWALNEDRVKPWNITKIYKIDDSIINRLIGNHKITYKATYISPNYYLDIDVYGFDFSEGTVDFSCSVSLKDETRIYNQDEKYNADIEINSTQDVLYYERKTYNLSNFVKSLGVYKLDENEIQIDATKESDSLIQDCLYVQLYNLDNSLRYTYNYGHYNEEDNEFIDRPGDSFNFGYIYPSLLTFNYNGEINSTDIIKLGGGGMTTRDQLEAEQNK